MKGLIAVLFLSPSVVLADNYAFAREYCVMPQMLGDEIDASELKEITPEEAGIKLAFELGKSVPDVYADPTGQMKLAVNFHLGMRGCRVWGFQESFDMLADIVIRSVLSEGLVTSDACRGYDPQLGRFAFAVTKVRSKRNRFVTIGVLQSDEDPAPEIWVFETPSENETTNCVDGLS